MILASLLIAALLWTVACAIHARAAQQERRAVTGDAFHYLEWALRDAGVSPVDVDSAKG